MNRPPLSSSPRNAAHLYAPGFGPAGSARNALFRSLSALAAGGLLCLGSAGCLNLRPTSDPTRYFLLQPVEDDVTQPASQAGAAVSVAQVTVPAYLQRPWVVVRTSETEIRYSDFNRWAEPLDKGIQRVLAANLGSLLGTNRVVLNAGEQHAVGIELRLAVDRFDVSQDGTVVLDTRWRIRSENDLLAGHRGLRKTGPAPGEDPAGSAEAMSATLAELSQLIAADLRRSMDGSD